MKQTSAYIVGLLMGTNAVKLEQMAKSQVQENEFKMTNPEYMTDMTLQDWKLYTTQESLHEYNESLENVAKFEARLSEYALSAIKLDRHIAQEEHKLQAIRNESKKIVFERDLARKHAKEAKDRLREEKDYLHEQ